ncbi:MAG: arsenate reductase (glutaredoxin) [Pseudomonadota bacterium]
MTTVIHHNPKCGTSRNVLAMIRASGTEPLIVEYISEGWTRPQLLALFAAANLTPREALRVKGTPAEDLGLTAPDVSDDTLVHAMIEHPILVNRPIVCSPKGVKLCRPSEAVIEILETPLSSPFTKSDGEVVGPGLPDSD